MKRTNCVIYDCEFDEYVDGLIIDTKVFVRGWLNNPIPAKEKICEHVDYGMVQFYVGEYDPCLFSGDAKWGYFNFSDGEIVVPPIYDHAAPFYGDRARVVLKDKQGFIDPYGYIAINLIWDSCFGGFHNGLCAVKKCFLWGFIDKNGRIVIPPIFEQAEQFVSIKNDIFLARIKKEGKYGFVDENGKLVVQPRFEMAEEFVLIKEKTSVALVKIDGKYGYIDSEDHYIFEPCFDDAKPFWEKGFAPVMTKGLWAFIDIYGDFVVPFQFEQVGDVFFNDRFYTVQKKDQWGIMDENLNVLMPEKDVRYVIYEDRKIYLENGWITSDCKFST